MIGIRTHVNVIDKSLNNQRTEANGWANQATHISGTWPELFKCQTFSQSVGYKFEGKSRWYSGWSTRKFCNYNISTNCETYWEQPGSSEQWTWIDGPYKVQVVVDYNYYWNYSFEFIN